MSASKLFAHLATGSAHVCQAWSITRKDGRTYGFTDHDCDLTFDDILFHANSGLSARALATSTGLSVDNSEAVGLLQSDMIRDADIMAGRLDGAEITHWLVRWDNVTERAIRFRGEIGEITREGGQFKVALRGLAERLNQPVGRSFLRSCAAVLGDGACGVDLADDRLHKDRRIDAVTDGATLTVVASGVDDHWFTNGFIQVLDGAGVGLTAVIKDHRAEGSLQRIRLWDALRADVVAGDRVRLIAGCDKRAETCREKFANLVNFQGFPDMPGDDWLMAVPRADGDTDGGSLVR
ncbi:DUF2163 domain-containing protein [Loktanella sp. TSTF-M6]|uniref:DUF2163 domain-containing protein n=1 Tax=Loktanella gaetbuli TaxID=2881335 RepID=A0ABS8BQ50_9RHOB|nr:DUF2163 domain-containing protein [Loktanella gaetbuli]MCB5197847.1 DUF2163 domain-containing protein [Loktanella gaetbuli]